MAKILFIQLHEWQQLGIMYLSSILKKRGHLVELAIGSKFEKIASTYEGFMPDVVGFSIMTGDHQWAADMARVIKSKYMVTTLFGGPHVTYFPEYVYTDCVDAVVRGEGEKACLEFMDAIDEGRSFTHVRNLWFKEGNEIIKNEMSSFEDINTIEFPDRDIYRKYNGKIDSSAMYILTSRGCPYKCSFCFEEQQRELYQGLGKYVRIRTRENIINEILYVNSKNIKYDYIMFIDDIFGLNKEWLCSFLSKYKYEVGRPFSCLVRADVVSRFDDYAKLLAEAGCISVAFGIESGSEDLRNRILRKRLKNEEIIDAANKLRSEGIKFKTYNIFGFPGETVEDSIATVELNIKIKTDYPLSNLFIPFPKTRLSEYAMEQGFLDSNFNINDIRNDTFIHTVLKSQNKKFFEKINKMFQTAVCYPFLWSLIKRYCLSNIDNRFLERVTDLWFGFFYFLLYWRSSKRNIIKLTFYGVKNLKKFLGINQQNA